MRGNAVRGQMGLGAMIILVAILLAAGVSAIILITTGGTLEQKSLIISRDSRKDVVSGVEIMSVIGKDASTSDPNGSPHVIDDIHIMVRLLPGTLTLAFNNTIINIEARNYTQTVVYNNTCEDECDSYSYSEYMVYYLNEGTNHENGYLNLGDVAKIAVKSQGIREDDDIRLSILPAHGPRTLIKILTPSTMVAQRVTLWPTTY